MIYVCTVPNPELPVAYTYYDHLSFYVRFAAKQPCWRALNSQFVLTCSSLAPQLDLEVCTAGIDANIVW